MVVQGCVCGGRRTGKAYRFWMPAETLEVFLELQILPDSERPHCETCEAGIRNSQAACPQKGDDRARERDSEGIPGDEEGHEEQGPGAARGSNR